MGEVINLVRLEDVFIRLEVSNHSQDILLGVAEISFGSQSVQQQRVEVEGESCVYLAPVTANVGLALSDGNEGLPVRAVPTHSDIGRPLVAEWSSARLSLLLGSNKGNVFRSDRLQNVEQTFSFFFEISVLKHQILLRLVVL